ncbi:MAG TPA: ABC transporter ATP-binding protein [Candidatus Hydrogenedentes bacterium]|jgi:ABC-type Fe3+/spermidine/putrescine transport system ATPase subunit|nr:ABC transporter ATP-binding protein [Candidatus Hydrogenedentota bacterium]NLT59539.1 ABC transporter ATP-binding protein [Candidatus Hydrogenedentota bacterium]HNV22635.1 ABC transporter ATP-binding protein [Candidatus Hydrogenedentota bacterium]HNZ19550.1 ABC transporter ATP-binding protein [Candidatus Hydrogenedentota bacterium]HOH34972.1 ABC transporter ATP-binding protein [Candidatus Hydrogenedentota bacterium]
MSSVQFQNVSRIFPEGGGIREFTCDIAEGEFFALLGPSGCGKTTTLRIAAGLETPDSGTVAFDGRDVTHLAPEKRNAAMVFQSYALFPHMSVFENVAFGLRARKMPRAELAARVEESLALVQLAGMGKRDVTELSGGQQQRVALARALAVHPRILLLDEPLSNLDAELRFSTRQQLAELQKRLGITAIYVTHDQEEALALAQRIAVLKDGACHQIGSPDEILHQPATPFVRAFLDRQRNAEMRTRD